MAEDPPPTKRKLWYPGKKSRLEKKKQVVKEENPESTPQDVVASPSRTIAEKPLEDHPSTKGKLWYPGIKNRSEKKEQVVNTEETGIGKTPENQLRTKRKLWYPGKKSRLEKQKQAMKEEPPESAPQEVVASPSRALSDPALASSTTPSATTVVPIFTAPSAVALPDHPTSPSPAPPEPQPQIRPARRVKLRPENEPETPPHQVQRAPLLIRLPLCIFNAIFSQHTVILLAVLYNVGLIFYNEFYSTLQDTYILGNKRNETKYEIKIPEILVITTTTTTTPKPRRSRRRREVPSSSASIHHVPALKLLFYLH